MTVQEAIDILDNLHERQSDLFIPFELEALTFGIEALKRVKYAQPGAASMTYIPLPGETKEES